jgi:damage-control phosphatase, subfamily III
MYVFKIDVTGAFEGKCDREAESYHLKRWNSPNLFLLCLQDLSLLPNLTASDLAHLQSVGREAQEARQKFILRDDQEAVWQHVMSMKDGRVDFVLDNGKPRLPLSPKNTSHTSVFKPVLRCIHRVTKESRRTTLTRLQLFTDLVFADFLVTYTPYVSRVVFQCESLLV